MKAGGLNPMLAYMKGGASTPTGATGSASAASGSTANMQNEWAAMANSAANIGLQLAQVKNIQAQTNKTNVDAALAATQLPKRKIGEDIWDILQERLIRYHKLRTRLPTRSERMVEITTTSVTHSTKQTTTSGKQ